MQIRCELLTNTVQRSPTSGQRYDRGTGFVAHTLLRCEIDSYQTTSEASRSGDEAQQFPLYTLSVSSAYHLLLLPPNPASRAARCSIGGGLPPAALPTRTVIPPRPAPH